MAARNDVRQLLADRLVPLLSDVERVIHRYGYLRTFSGAVPLIGTLGVLGGILGLTWLRVAFATAAGLSLVLVSAVSLTSLATMRDRATRAETLLHRYAAGLQTRSPLSIKRWYQEMTIQPNGDARHRLEVTLNRTDGDEPHYVETNMIYYGSAPLTPRARRAVRCKAWRTTLEDKNAKVRADATSTWTASAHGHPKLEIFVHFDSAVRQNDVIIVEWDWPGFSAGLMRGRRRETFDVVFTREIEEFEGVVVFQGTARNSSFTIHKEGLVNLIKTEERGDTVIRFSDTFPTHGKKLGFTADFCD